MYTELELCIVPIIEIPPPVHSVSQMQYLGDPEADFVAVTTDASVSRTGSHPSVAVLLTSQPDVWVADERFDPQSVLAETIASEPETRMVVVSASH